MNKRLRKAFEVNKESFKQKRTIIRAILGNGKGVVETSRANYVYARTTDGNIVTVLNKRTANIDGLAVFLGFTEEEPFHMQVLGEFSAYNIVADTQLPEHEKSHEWPYNDTVYVHGEQFTPWLVVPFSGTSVQLYGGIAYTVSGAVYAPNQYVDLSSYIPTTGAMYALLGLNATGAVIIQPGNLKASVSLLVPNDIPVPSGTFPLAAIRLKAGQQTISKTASVRDIVDMRWAGYSVLSNTTCVCTGGASGGVDQIGIYGQDEGIPLGTGTILNAVGAGITLTLSGSVLNMSVPGGGGGFDGYGVAVEKDGAFKVSGTVLNFLNDNIFIEVTGTAAYISVSGSSSSGAGAVPHEPGGRLTLTSGTPVMTSDTASQTSIYYVPYKGDLAPIYDGSTWTETTFTTLILALDSNAAHTGYHQSGKLFDLFVYNDSGTVRLVSGPAWTNDTTRATALEYVNGILMNAASMTARYGSGASDTVTVAQDRGTYVGTFYASAGGTTTWEIGGDAAGGDPIRLYLWNAYNRVRIDTICCDNTNSWAYSTATWRSKNNSTSNRASFVRGLSEDGVQATNVMLVGQTVAGAVRWGICLDATNTFTVNCQINSTAAISATSYYSENPGLGFHFLQAVEFGNSAGTTSWFGDNSGNNRHGLTFSGMF